MKRILTLAVLVAGVAWPSLAQPANATVRELLAALKSHSSNWIVIPIAGTGYGQHGSVFHSDIAITAGDGYGDLRVAIAWLPVGRDASEDRVRYMTLPGDFDNGAVVYPDGFGLTGFGAIVIAAVDSNGALKAEFTHVRADVRVWSTANCPGEASLSYRSMTHWLGADRGTAIGLTVDDGFRTNAGIVNADAAPHTWRVRSTSLIDGSSYDSEITVAAASSAIVGLAPGTEGPISVTIESTSPDLSWTGWAASVDNRSGDPWYSSLSPD
jgi:hypothetical protein